MFTTKVRLPVPTGTPQEIEVGVKEKEVQASWLD